jgi:hypothetical protein
MGGGMGGGLEGVRVDNGTGGFEVRLGRRGIMRQTSSGRGGAILPALRTPDDSLRVSAVSIVASPPTPSVTLSSFPS